jgi:hypothetical protein
MTINHSQVATLNVLYSEQPNGNGGRFIEIRRWETPDGERSELVVERGCVVGDDLETQCLVMPFHLSWAEALQLLDAETSNIPIETFTEANIG